MPYLHPVESFEMAGVPEGARLVTMPDRARGGHPERLQCGMTNARPRLQQITDGGSL